MVKPVSFKGFQKGFQGGRFSSENDVFVSKPLCLGESRCGAFAFLI